MRFVAERLAQFAAMIEQEFTRQKDHIQQCVDSWVTRFTQEQERKLQGEKESHKRDLESHKCDLQTGMRYLESRIVEVETAVQGLQLERIKLVTEEALEKRLVETKKELQEASNGSADLTLVSNQQPAFGPVRATSRGPAIGNGGSWPDGGDPLNNRMQPRYNQSLLQFQWQDLIQHRKQHHDQQ